nr:hypothetical protein [Tanacetum cinerariifolium]
METIHVKFDELTTMASKCNNLEPEFNIMNFQDLSDDSQSLPSKTDLDNLFGPLYEEYYSTSLPEVVDNFAANTLDNENTSSSSSIFVEEDEAPQIVSSSTDQVASEPNTPVLNENADDFIQEDVVEFDENVFIIHLKLLYLKKLSHLQSHTERIERFENAIFKQQEEIKNRMTEMFRLLKELTTSRAPEKVLIREEDKNGVTKNVNSISLTRREEEKNDDDNATTDDSIEKHDRSDVEMPLKEDEKENEAVNRSRNKPIKSDKKELTQAEEEEAVKAPSFQPVRGAIYEAILKKKITKNENIRGNFKIPCNTGGLKYMNALVDQGSNLNVMPLSTYKKLTDKRHAETDIRLSLASHSYIYHLEIAEDVLVDVAGYVYPVEFIFLDIKEDEKRPFILGTPFLTTAKFVIKFNKGTITLRSGKSEMSFHRIPKSLCKIEKGIKNDIEHIAPTMTVNRQVLEWEERIKVH